MDGIVHGPVYVLFVPDSIPGTKLNAFDGCQLEWMRPSTRICITWVAIRSCGVASFADEASPMSGRFPSTVLKSS